MATLLIPPNMQFIDANGAPFAGGFLYSYVPSTFVAKTTWLDPGESSANTNPIVLDSAGRCVVFGDDDYRLILRDALGNQIFDELSSSTVLSSAISAVMAPVVAASTLSQARDLMGITSAIAAAIAAVELEPGASGPQGIQGPVGPIGPQGPSGAAGSSIQAIINDPGYILFGTYGSAPLIQFGTGSSNGSGFGNVSYLLPFTNPVQNIQITPSGRSVFTGVSSLGNTGFTANVTSPNAGGDWSFAAPFFWLAIGQ